MKARSKRVVDEWLPAPDMPPLAEAEVHVWRVWLHLDTPRVEALRQTLSAEERRKGERFRFQADRVRYTAAHGFLREILARYLGVSAIALEFVQGEHGKPSLVAPRGGDRLKFNLSHSEDLALVAVALDRDVGVDIESLNRQVDVLEIARQFFSVREALALGRIGAPRQGMAFLRLWTRKEALLKAVGTGLTAGVQALNGDEAVKSRDQEWRVRCLKPGTGYAGAVAAEGRSWRLERGHWPGP